MHVGVPEPGCPSVGLPVTEPKSSIRSVMSIVQVNACLVVEAEAQVPVVEALHRLFDSFVTSNGFPVLDSEITCRPLSDSRERINREKKP